MKSKTASLFSSIVVSLAAVTSAQAQTSYTWAGASGTPGTWDTVTANWNPGPVVWPNTTSPGHNALFGLATATTNVTLSGTINANSIVFTNMNGGDFSQFWNLTGGTLNLVGAALLDPQSGNQNVRINSVITGSAGLNLDTTVGSRNSASGIQLGGDNTYTGVTTIRDSALVARHNNAYGATGSGNHTEIYSGKLVLSINTPLNVPEDIILIGGDGSSIRASDSNHTLSGNVEVRASTDAGINVNTANAFTVAGSLTTGGNPTGNRRISLNSSGGANSKVIVTGSISDGSDGTQTRLMIDGSATGANTGTVELAAANSFSGSITIRRGTLVLSDPDAVSSAGSIAFADGGLGDSTNTLRLLTNGAFTVSNGISLNGASGTNTYTAVIGGNSADVSEFTTNITIADANAGTYQLTAASGGEVHFSGVIQDYTLSKAIGITGAGTVVLTNANTYDGATTIASGATLQLGNNGTTGALNIASAITNNGTLLFNRSNDFTQGTHFAPAIGGTGALVKKGGGTLFLSGNNASTAGFTINEGRVFVTHNNALGASGNVVTMPGLNANTELRLNAGGLNVANPINITASTGTNAPILRSQVGESTLSGPITYKNTGGGRIDYLVVVATGTTLNLNGGVTADDTSNAQVSRIVFNANGTANMNSQVNNSTGNSRAMAVQQYGDTATVNWNAGSAGSTFTGGYEVLKGNVNVNVDAPFDGSSVMLGFGPAFTGANINFLIGGANTVGSPLQINANPSGLTTVGGANTSGTSTFSGDVGFVASRDLLLTAAAGGTVEFTGDITDGTLTGSLTKVGDGTVVLAGANAYDGNTTVSTGTLTLAAGGTQRLTIGASGVNNQIINNGTLNLNGTLVFNLAGAGTTVGNSWPVITGTAPTYGGTFAVASTNGTFSLSGGKWSRVENGATYEFDPATGVLSVVPAGSSAYTTWAVTTHSLSGGNELPGADPDNDGLDNLMEFVLGGIPTTSQSGIAPAAVASGSNLVLTFLRSDESETEPVAVKVQVSADLGIWTDDTIIGATDGTGPNGITYTVAENGAAADTVAVTIPMGAATRKFARVVATK